MNSKAKQGGGNSKEEPGLRDFSKVEPSLHGVLG